MKTLILALALLFLASAASAQLPTEPPTMTAHVPSLLADNAHVGDDFIALLSDVNIKETWITLGLHSFDDQIQALKAQVATQADTIQKMQTDYAALLAKVNAITTGPNPPSTATVVHVEAEAFVASSPVAAIQPTEGSATNKNICCLTAATTATADYTITIPSDGNYAVSARTASARAGVLLSFSVGTVTSGNLTLVNTGGWQTFTVIQSPNPPMALKAGLQTIRMTYGQFGNVDYFELTKQP
jgi:hypothetical protein